MKTIRLMLVLTLVGGVLPVSVQEVVFNYRFASMSPNGAFVAAVRYALGIEDGEIVILSSVSGAVMSILPDVEGQNFPVWSPNGLALAYVQCRASGVGCDIVVMKWSDEVTLEIVEMIVLEVDALPPSRVSWSPDSNEIVFAQLIETIPMVDSQICTVGVDTKELECFDYPGLQMDPAWSPDGGRVAVVSMVPGKSDALYVLEWGAGELGEPIFSLDVGAMAGPTWSPEGDWLAVTTGYQVALWLVRVEDGISEWISGRVDGVDAHSPVWYPGNELLVIATEQNLDYGSLNQVYMVGQAGASCVCITCSRENGAPTELALLCLD